jgi:hypothetical protein
MCGTKLSQGMNRNKEKLMRSLFLASTSWLENVCYLAKEIINAKMY